MFKFSRKFVFLLLVTLSLSFVVAEESDDANTLKCIVKYLTGKGVTEDFFSSVDKKIDSQVDCDNLMNIKLTKAYGKIHDKLKADSFFAKYTGCIMDAIKTEPNRIIILQREAIKINGLGVAVWNYFSQKEHLDELKKKIETAINKAASEKCVTVY